MNRRHLVGAAIALLLTPVSAPAQISVSVKDVTEVIAKRGERLQSVTTYVERMGSPSNLRIGLPEGQVGPCLKDCRVYEVETVELANGTTTLWERPLSRLEVAILSGDSPGSDFLRLMGSGLITAQQELNEHVFGGEMFSEFGESLMNPRSIFALVGVMAILTAEAVDGAGESLATSRQQAQADADRTTRATAQLELVGEETVNGARTLHFRAGNLAAPSQAHSGQEFAPTGLSIWVDPEALVFPKHRFEGQAISEGESREFFVEVVSSDFRNPPGCGDMLVPFRRVLRLGGILDTAQMAEMEQARAQLAEYDQRMAEMPPEQRAQMELLLGEQLKTARGLLGGGTIEHVEEVEEVLCNPDLAKLFHVPGAESSVALIRQVQEDLVALGYEPGNTEGILDTMTRVAIAQFQAEHGLPVTGEPTGELALTLAYEVERRQAA